MQKGSSDVFQVPFQGLLSNPLYLLRLPEEVVAVQESTGVRDRVLAESSGQ